MSVRRVFVGIAPLLLVLAPTLAEAQQKFVAALRSNQEVPTNVSTAMGTCTVTLNAAQTQVTTTCDYQGLGSALQAGHIHGPAAPVGVNAAVMINFNPPAGSTSGTFTTGALDISAPGLAALLSNNLYINLHTTNIPGGEIRGQLKRSTTVFDRDGDGRTDAAVFRQSSMTFWTEGSLNGTVTGDVFGTASGENFLGVMPGEWDGDGIADYVLIRIDVNNNAVWSIFQSRTQTARSVVWGNFVASVGDTLTPADYDGDGIIDIAVFRRLTGDWWILQSATGTTRFEHFGASTGSATTGDQPSVGDYDGDGKADLTVVRTVSGQRMWFTLRSSDGVVTSTPFGASATDGFFFFAPIDVDGDNKQDIMVNRSVSGQRQFFVLRSSDGAVNFTTWGTTTAPVDQTLFGDYDGDGKTDIVARRIVGGQLIWYVNQSSNGQLRVIYWGISGDQ